MSEIKTNIQSSEPVIHSQNKVVHNYAEQLKSAVVSADHKKAILREMQLELTAQHYRRPEHRSVACEVTHNSSVKLEMSSQPSLIQTGGQVSAPSVQTAVDNSFIKTRRSTDFIKTSTLIYSDDVKEIFKASENLDEKIAKANKLWQKKVKSHALGLKQRGLKNKKYTFAKLDSEGSEAIEMVQIVQSAGSAVSKAGGMIRTAVKSTSNGIGSIKTMVKNGGVKLGSRKDISRIATSVKGSVANIAKDTGQQLLKTKIDKSKITDTGSEAIKQGLTDLRYVDNARKAVVNTARTTAKAGYAVKNLPKNARAKAQEAKNNVKRVKEAAKKTAATVKKVLTSKVFWILMLVALLVLLVVLLINGIITVICSAVSSLFAWMCPDGDTSDKTIKNNIGTYISQIQQCETDIQAEIDAVVNSLAPEYRYDGTQIQGLNQFANSKLQLYDYNAVLAVLATQKYQKVLEGGTDDFYFTVEEIREAVEMFYSFTYYYGYDYCPNWDCSLDENCLLSLSANSFEISGISYNSYYNYYEVTMHEPTYEHASSMYTYLEIYMLEGGTISGSGYADVSGGMWSITYTISTDAYVQIDWDEFYLTVSTVYCNNSNHCYMYGGVYNYDIETVMQKAGFDDEEREIFEIYLAQIEAINGV